MKRRALLDWERQAIIDAYCADEKLDAIAEEFGVVRHYPTMLARRAGFPPRGRGRPRLSEKKFTRLQVRINV